MRQYPLYILDLDGTLYRGSQALPEAVEVVRELRSREALVRYLTNNSSLEQEAYADKLTGLGFEASPEEVYSSGIGAARFCESEGLEEVFVVGEMGLVRTLERTGVRAVNASAKGLETSVAEVAQAVVAGICRGFSYDLMNGTMQQILSGAQFLATNTDATYPMEGGLLIPGAGAIVSAIRTCSGQEPHVIGKPNPFLIDLILADTEMKPGDALVVGDRVSTDIESGRRAGCDTHLVLTGVTTSAPKGQSFSEDLRALLD